MEGQNPGSFASILGGSGSALLQAMQKRGIDPNSIPALSQVSASAPTATDNLPPQPVPEASPQIGTIEGVAAQAAGQPQQETPFRSGESQIALEALSNTAKVEADIAKNILKMRTQGLA